MSCKYCKKGEHLIDNCPEIICKKCRIVGHPFWKCKKMTRPSTKPQITATTTTPTTTASGILNRNTPSTPTNTSMMPSSPSPSSSTPIVAIKSDTYADALCNADNKIAYYMKYQGIRWSAMI